MVITDTRELDCMIVVDTTPNPRLRPRLDVDLRKIFSSVPPVNRLKPCSSESIPNRNIATPAAISLKSALFQKPTARIIKIVGSRILRSINASHHVPIEIRS